MNSKIIMFMPKESLEYFIAAIEDLANRIRQKAGEREFSVTP